MATVSELHRAWVEAHQAAESAKHLLRAAEDAEREAMQKLAKAEKAFGRSALEQVSAAKDQHGRRSHLIQIGDTVFRVDDEYDGVRECHNVTVVPFPVTRLMVG